MSLHDFYSMNLDFCLVNLCCYVHQKDVSEYGDGRDHYGKRACDHCGECLQYVCGHEHLMHDDLLDDGFHGNGTHLRDTLGVRGDQRLGGFRWTGLNACAQDH